MKKLFTLFAAALVMLAAASCEKNEVLPDNNTNGKVITLKATINNGETKTSLGTGVAVPDSDPVTYTYPVLWSERDAIAVIQGSEVYKFNLVSVDNNGQSGTFELDNTLQYQTEFDASAEVKAFYPYDWVNSNGTKCEIPTDQTYAVNSFGNGASPMAAYRVAGNNGALGFQNLFGALKLQIKGMEDENVQSIEIESSNKIAGPAQLKVNQNNQVFSLKIDVAGGDAENCVTLKCEGISIKETTDFIIALHPNANQLKIKIYTNKAVYYRTIDRDNIITAGTILKMAELADMAPAYIDENGVYQGDGIALPAGNDKTIIWAPVNCGYEPANDDYEGYPYGKLYQWGRKYGQGYDGNDDSYPTGESLVNAFVSLEQGQSKENENIFYKVSSSTDNDWLNNPNNKLWNSGNEDSPVKTDYDPCPDGWRVPTKSELTSLKEGFRIKDGTFNNQKGAWFYGMIDGDPTESSSKLFLPFAGKRDKWGQPASQRNNEGYYWSSSVEYNQAFKMDFGSSNIAINTMARAYGFSVRCVKDVSQSEPMPSSN